MIPLQIVEHHQAYTARMVFHVYKNGHSVTLFGIDLL